MSKNILLSLLLSSVSFSVLPTKSVLSDYEADDECSSLISSQKSMLEESTDDEETMPVTSAEKEPYSVVWFEEPHSIFKGITQYTHNGGMGPESHQIEMLEFKDGEVEAFHTYPATKILNGQLEHYSKTSKIADPQSPDNSETYALFRKIQNFKNTR